MSDENKKKDVEYLQERISEEIPMLQRCMQELVGMIAEITDNGAIRRIGLDQARVQQDKGLDFAIERMDTLCSTLNDIRVQVFNAQSKSSNLSAAMKVLRAKRKLTSS
jgi:hypothetical protein